MHTLILAVILAPLLGSILAGVAGQTLGRSGAHSVTIAGVAIAFIASLCIAKSIFLDNAPDFNVDFYKWGITGSFTFNIGFLIDRLSAVMLIIVTSVSLVVHVYSVGYMHDDPGYQRFFSYISFFTFAMLMLVSANNFLQLYFGWEGVGLASYLLIGFWFQREPANFGSLKAFLVNRVGDAGFLLGIAAILDYFGTVDYASVFAQAPAMVNETVNIIPGVVSWPILTTICILLFIGAMGKSAQMPLHVWLPESMEGPTPISALIHAATMVTAGVYMVARMSPLFEYSQTALSLVLVIGATGALFTGILALVQTDIKRVIAYSTLSQLGYMIAALGVSAFAAGIFHLVTHAFFKALLFLAAGSVIIALHHEQDMRKMGNLRKYLPITYITFLIGALSLSAIPPFAGYYSKDNIIDAIALATIPGARYAYVCVLIGAFVTALYIFRAFFLVFHTEDRVEPDVRHHLKEPGWVIWMPLVVLAVPSVIAGAWLVGPILFDTNNLLGHTIFVLPKYDVLAQLAPEFQDVTAMTWHAIYSLPFWFAVSGIIVAWVSYIVYPQFPKVLAQRFALLYNVLLRKYGFDDFNQIVFVRGGRNLARFLYYIADLKMIDGWFVNGSGRAVEWCSRLVRRSQSGYLYHYAFAMILGLLVFLAWLLLG